MSNHNVSFHLNNHKKEEKIKLSSSRRKNIIAIRLKFNKIKNKILLFLNKSWFFEKKCQHFQ